MRPLPILPVLVCAALALSSPLTGCTKQGPPSPEYLEARAEFSALYGKHLEDAYLLPEMQGIEAKLERVAPESEHANEARSLLLRIRSGRERVEGLRADREELVRRAHEPVGSGRFEEPKAEVEDAGPAKASAEEPPDAGSEGPVAGMPISELTRRFGDCFLGGETIVVEGRGERQTWKLRDSVFCRQRHPGFEDRIVVEEAGAVLSVANRSQLEKRDR